MIIANWKSNIVDIGQWDQDFHDEYIVNERLQSTIFGVAPPSLYIETMHLMRALNLPGHSALQEVLCGVQDVDHSYGSRTGAISVDMVIDTGCNFAIIGHSERRDLFNEDNDFIKKKLKSLKNKVMAVLCIGETKEENDKGITKDVLKQQLDIVKEVELDQSFTVAYEPVWAIGSGLTPQPKDILSLIHI